jgi:transposase
MVGSASSSDLTDAEWEVIEPLLTPAVPASSAGADARSVINSIFFLLRSGSALHTAPPWSTAESYYSQWRSDGTWEKVLTTLQAAQSVRILRSDRSPPPGG